MLPLLAHIMTPKNQVPHKVHNIRPNDIFILMPIPPLPPPPLSQTASRRLSPLSTDLG